MNLKPSDIYSLIIVISLKKGIDASVNTNIMEVKVLETIMFLMVTYFFNIEIIVNVFILKILMYCRDR